MITAKQTLKRWIRGALREYRFQLVVLDGLEKNSGEKTTLVTSVSGPERIYLAELVFGGNYTERRKLTVWIWNLRKIARKNGADLLVHFSREGAVPGCLARQRIFRIPVWIRGNIDFDTVERLKANSKNVNRDFGRVRRNGLTYRVTRDPQQFEKFYSVMHIPHSRKAHGQAAHLTAHEEFRSMIDGSELLWVQKDGEAIAGQMIIFRGGRAHIWMLGVKDGSIEYVKMGALAACYIFSMQHLRENGFEHMQAGSTKAFLNDGVLQFKRKWGMKIIGAKKSLFLLEVIKSSSGAKAFLYNNPFCQLSDGNLIAEIFVNADENLSEEKLLELNKLFYFPGMSHMNIYRFGATGISDTKIPGDLSDHITVHDAGSTIFKAAV